MPTTESEVLRVEADSLVCRSGEDPEFVISTERYIKDDGVVLLSEGADLESFSKNSPLYFDHGVHERYPAPVGHVHSVKREGGKIVARVATAKTTDGLEMKSLIDSGAIKATSIRARRVEARAATEEERTRFGIPKDAPYASVWTKWRPREVSLVGLPADDMALKRMLERTPDPKPAALSEETLKKALDSAVAPIQESIRSLTVSVDSLEAEIALARGSSGDLGRETPGISPGRSAAEPILLEGLKEALAHLKRAAEPTKNDDRREQEDGRHDGAGAR